MKTQRLTSSDHGEKSIRGVCSGPGFRAGERGVVLLEMTMGMIIIAIAIVGLLYGVVNSIIATNRIDGERTAMALARSQLEFIKTKPFIVPAGADPLKCKVTENMAGGLTNVTLTYVNQDGQVGRTATATIPQDAPVGSSSVNIILEGLDWGVLQITDVSVSTTGIDVTDGAFVIRDPDATSETALGYFQVTGSNQGQYTDIYVVGSSQYNCRVTTGMTGGPTTVAIGYINQNGRTNSLTGNVTVTSGSTNVIGNSTAFNSELFVGDYIIIDSHNIPVQVESIGGDTSLTLAENYPGVSDFGPASLVGIAVIPANAGAGTVVDIAMPGRDSRALHFTDSVITGGAGGGQFSIENEETRSVLGRLFVTGPDTGVYVDDYSGGHHDNVINLQFFKQSDYLYRVHVDVFYIDRRFELDGYKSGTH